MLVGLNRGAAPFRWTVSLADGEAVKQVFTASGEFDRITIEQKGAQATIAVPPVDGVVLRVEPGTRK